MSIPQCIILILYFWKLQWKLHCENVANMPYRKQVPLNWQGKELKLVSLIIWFHRGCCLLDKREFLRGMRDYMPIRHREFLSFMDKTPTIQDYSKSNVMWYFICWFVCNIAFYWLTWAFQSLFLVDPSVSNVTLLFIGYCLQFLVTVATQYTTDIHMVYRRSSLWKLLYSHPCCISNSRESILTRSIP